jgi:hypothetical protein
MKQILLAFFTAFLIYSCGDDNNTTNNGNNNGEVILDTDIVLIIPPGISSTTLIYLFLNNSNKIKVEFTYSSNNPINNTKLFEYLIDTTCCIWTIDSVIAFSSTPANKLFEFNPNNGNKKKLKIDIRYNNTWSDTEYVKLNDFKVSKLN